MCIVCCFCIINKRDYYNKGITKIILLKYLSNMNKKILKLYHDPSRIGSFGGIEKFYNSAKIDLPGITLNDVKKCLRADDSYTLFKPIRRKYKTNATYVPGARIQYQIDLLDMQKYAKYNKGFRYILTCIDCFSRFAWARPLRTKRGPEIVQAFSSIDPKPFVVQCDKGKEFYNNAFKQYLKKNKIHLFSTDSAMKCSIVERFHRTLRVRMQRMFYHQNSFEWFGELEKLVRAYNNTFHRTIKMAPSMVDDKTCILVTQALHEGRRKSSHPSFKIGDTVRISEHRRLFKKSYEPSWTGEYFKIVKILERNPTVYKLRDIAGEKLSGVFYAEELQLIDASRDTVYRIEKVLKRVGNKVLVRWQNWPDKFNSWLDRQDIKKLQ